MAYASKPIRIAAQQASRPAAKWAALAASVLFACSIARSDASIQSRANLSIDTSRISGTNVRIKGVVASAQQLLTATKPDDIGVTPEHVSSLQIDTKIHARRVTEYADPIVRFSSSLQPGQRRTLHAGSPTIAWVTERVTLWNDVVVNRQVLSRQVIRPAERGVVLIGAPKTLAQFRAAFPEHVFSTAMTMVATAYTADSATSSPTGYTATGTLARQGVVAVDPRVIPLGTKLFVPGYGVAIAADTGGAIIGNRIDLCMDSYGDAVNFGRQTVQVYIIKR